MILKVSHDYITRLINEAIASKAEREYFGSAIARLIEKPHLLNNRVWLKKNSIVPIDSGASRGVYAVKSDKDILIKQAIIPRGKIDNQREVEKFKTYPNLFPKTYAHAPDFEWIVVERVDVIGKDSSRNVMMLKQYMPKVYNLIITKMQQAGLSTTNPNAIKDAYYDLIFNLEARYHGLKTIAKDQSGGNPTLFENIFKRLIEITKGRPVNVVYLDKDILSVLMSDKKFYQIYKVASKYNIAFRELRGDNFGINRNNDLVLIDISIMDY